MRETLDRLRRQAAELASALPRPSFYSRCEDQMRYSWSVFFDHPVVLRLREDVLPFLMDEYGHGIEHSKTVAIEAGAIALAELGHDIARARRLSLLAQLAGLLHDTRRMEKHHAAKGAELADIILHDYPLDAEEKRTVAFAVASHEAFTDHAPPGDRDSALVAGALYDADKFRWGPDNFTTTLWEMCDYLELGLDEIARRFPHGVEMIGRIADTFRTDTGRRYGPEFIEIGLVLGREVHALLQRAVA